MIKFPKYISPASRYILIFYFQSGRNKKLAAYQADVSLRSVQRSVAKHREWIKEVEKENVSLVAQPLCVEKQ